MALSSFLVLSHLVLLLHSAAEAEYKFEAGCPRSFNCGVHGPISFPFANPTYSKCGLATVSCDESLATIQLGPNVYDVISPLQSDTIRIHDAVLQDHIYNHNCDYFNDLTSFPDSPFISFTSSPNLTLFKCAKTPQADDYFRGNYTFTECPDDTFYYMYPPPDHQWPIYGSLPPNCSVIHRPLLPPDREKNANHLFALFAAEFFLEFNASEACDVCRQSGGRCLNEKYEFQCLIAKEGRNKLKLILATAIPGAVILVICLLIFIIWRRNKRNSSYFISRNTFDPSSKADLEGGTVFFGVPVFSHTELEESTKKFHPSKVLGDGGYGTVYHGKLQDGREVAVKRLYERNYKQVEQFMNEIKILTRLHHPNLVSLYGCTSRHSRELLLVYEYIPNGTVADHLHGYVAKPGSLTWPIRMNIAIETVTALAYLHASDIIHRDVKTTNILLDNNFCVKVADFGLSRLFPTDVSHVSTAPQGTPGYVDPEYHQCYQLTDKSDVYSFGVVLVELISSMPAVDTSRHRHEINLANLAMNRIQKCAFSELVDPSLGFESETMIQRMITSVAELAFRCLQQEKDMRPTMDEVLESLKEIQGEEYQEEKTGEVIGDVGALKSVQPPPSPESDDVGLLKNTQKSPSPDSVTEKWVSRSTTPNTSG